MLQPLPDREEFEREIRGLLSDGDITDSARYLQMGRTSLSKMLNPDVPERLNPFWMTLGLLWTFDAKGNGLAPQIECIMKRRRMLWLPKSVVESNAAHSTSRIGKELMDLIEKEMNGCTQGELLKEAVEIETAVKDKIKEILAKRGI